MGICLRDSHACAQNHYHRARSRRWGDVYLLSIFARITLLVDRAFVDLNKAKPKERPTKVKMLDQLVKGQAQLSVKLRLSTSSRHDARKLSRQPMAHQIGPAPWGADVMTVAFGGQSGHVCF